MIYYILAAFVVLFLIVLALSIGGRMERWAFELRIEARSNLGKPMEINGVNYFFMTQDQIQNAVKSIISLEAEYNKPKSKMEVN